MATGNIVGSFYDSLLVKVKAAPHSLIATSLWSAQARDVSRILSNFLFADRGPSQGGKRPDMGAVSVSGTNIYSEAFV